MNKLKQGAGWAKTGGKKPVPNCTINPALAINLPARQCPVHCRWGAIRRSDRRTASMAFMFESRYAVRLTRYASDSAELQHDYFEGWQRLARHFHKLAS